MKMFKTMMPVAAAISLAAGLLGAAPAQAAVKLPAGCTSDDSPRYNADVYALECSTLSSNANFTQFPNLEWLTIGPETSETKSRVTITSLNAVKLSRDPVWQAGRGVHDLNGQGRWECWGMRFAFPGLEL